VGAARSAPPTFDRKEDEMTNSQGFINHVVLVLDASSSMSQHTSSLIRVADEQVKYLARRSQELDQETRVTIYSFANTVECLVFDRDVLRLPSIATLYRPYGMTALIDATLKSMDDLAETPERYGDHSFLIYVLTDGQENRSRNAPGHLQNRLENLRENWTVAVLVPDQLGKREAQQFGFPRDNIAIWDTTSASGVSEAGETIRRATDTFMENRSKGVRGTRTLFSTGVDAVNPATVSGLQVLPETSYEILPVRYKSPIREYVDKWGRNHNYVLGKGFYQLTKRETIQPQKAIAIREKSTGKVFFDQRARDILGLPQGVEVRVSPNTNPLYDVFIQSTSVNRNLVPDTDLLVLR
jgi:hypothetical protein